MTISFPSVIATNQINRFFVDIQNIDKTNKTTIILDTTTLQFVETTSANYFLLIPFYLKSQDLNIKIKINRKLETYRFLRKSGVISILEDYFDIFEVDENPTKKHFSLESIIAKNQEKIFNVLSSEPLFRTHIAQNDQDRKILKLLAREYKHYIEKSISNQTKISTCVTELLYNIFDHSEQGFGAISIHFYSQNKQPYMYIAVTDLGIGFKKSLLKSKKFHDQTNAPDSFFLKSSIELRTTSTDLSSRGLGLYYVSQHCDNLTIKSGYGTLIRSNDLQKPRFEVIDDKEDLLGSNIICILKIDM